MDASFITYFLNAGLVVKLVLLLLVGASIASWTYIIQRGFYLKDVREAMQEFEHAFWSGNDLSKLYAETKRGNVQGLEAIFHAGFKEFLRLRKQGGASPESMMESAKRAMRVAQMHEQDNLEMHLPLLATVGSTSPYVGLFGTVWGIMLSFRALAHVQQATIAMVAPGIAEALIATAMGLFAAIPAVVAYNRYSNDINRLLNRFDAFQEEFSNILFRQAQASIAHTSPDLVAPAVSNPARSNMTAEARGYRRPTEEDAVEYPTSTY
jgi:biopolymer transport protein TolQ